MYYFYKAGKLHRYPVSDKCGAQYEDEKLWDYTPHGFDECIFCLREWPEKGPTGSSGRVS